MTADEPYELVLARPAAPAITEGLPEAIATAVIDSVTGPLVENPRRVGRALRNELAGVHSARRGTYRVLYRVDDDAGEVIVLGIEHRGDVSRRR